MRAQKAAWGRPLHTPVARSQFIWHKAREMLGSFDCPPAVITTQP